MRRLLINILCGFVWNRKKRNILRMELNNPIRKWVKFAKSFSSEKHPKIKNTSGYRCGNFVVCVDDRWVFKFPIKTDGKEISIREKRIIDALRPISPIKIPEMEILDFEGLAVRKYEFIKGVGFHKLPREKQNKIADKIATQLAKYLYEIGCADPVEIRDLKPRPTDKTSIMHGWCQNDLWDNFIMDEKTFDVIAIIDWEGAGFNDFYGTFINGTGNSAVKIALLREYLRLGIHEK